MNDARSSLHRPGFASTSERCRTRGHTEHRICMQPACPNHAVRNVVLACAYTPAPPCGLSKKTQNPLHPHLKRRVGERQ